MKYLKLPNLLFVSAMLLSGSACSSSDELTKNLIEPPTKEEEIIISSAIDAYDRGLYSRSREEWVSLRDGYPASYFVPLAQMKIADCYFAAGEFPEAVSAYQEYLRAFPAHEAAAFAQYRVGEAYFQQYRGVKNDQQPLKEALKSYQQVSEKYPQSDYAQRAQEKTARVKELIADYERSVADFYEKQGEEKAAKRRRDAIK